MASPAARARHELQAAFGRERVRVARREDGAALCDLFRRVTMDGDLRVAVERDPDFFALYDIQETRERTLVAVVDGPAGEAIEGSGAFLAREGYLDGTRTTVGYLGDLRKSSRLRGGRFLDAHFGRELREAGHAFGVDVWLTGVLRSNLVARHALRRRSVAFPDKPVYQPIRDFSMVNVFFVRPRAYPSWRRPRPRPDIRIRRARDHDLACVADLLAEDQRARPFGYVIDESVIRRRLSRWPGLATESFYLAEDTARRLLGVCAPWDAFPVKRTRVIAYRGRMRWVKLAFNCLSGIAGAAPLPAAGGLLRYLYLTHVAVRGGDPDVLAALLTAIMEDGAGKDFHFIAAQVYDGDPLALAFAGRPRSSVPATLFAVSAPGSRFNRMEIGNRRVGFEMALA